MLFGGFPGAVSPHPTTVQKTEDKTMPTSTFTRFFKSILMGFDSQASHCLLCEFLGVKLSLTAQGNKCVFMIWIFPQRLSHIS